MNNELNELEFEEFIWTLFIIISFMNLKGTQIEEKYINTSKSEYKNEADKIFIFTLFVTLIIYNYFLLRNIRAYNNI